MRVVWVVWVVRVRDVWRWFGGLVSWVRRSGALRKAVLADVKYLVIGRDKSASLRKQRLRWLVATRGNTLS